VPPAASDPYPALVVTNGLFLPMDGTAPFRGWMAVGADGRISARGSGRPPAGLLGRRQLDVGGCFVAPGFVSAHSHLYSSGIRGLAADESLPGWLATTGTVIAGMGPEDVYWMTRHGARDCLVNGVTTVYDFCHNGLSFGSGPDGTTAIAAQVPSVDRQHAQLRAKIDSGLRHLHSVMLAQDGDAEHLRAHLEETLARAADATSDPLHLGLALTGTVPWAADRWTARAEAAVMRRLGLVNQPHLLESARDAMRQRNRFTWYQEAGALGPRLVFGHFIHTDDHIVSAVAAAGGAMTWQPASNGRLGSGIADIPRYRAAGIRVGLGLDGASSGDLSDPWANMRAGLYVQRAVNADPSCLGVAEVLDLHTRAAADVIGAGADVGSLAPGRYADFLVVDPTSPDTGPTWDPYGTYVLACGPQNIVSVYVGGTPVADRHGLVDRAEQARVNTYLHECLEPFQGSPEPAGCNDE